ncbi:MAG: DUF6089 family protein [Flavobacteriales bacterium]
MKYCFAFLSLIILSTSAKAQTYSQWKRLRYEVTFGLGIANFLGDLGGANNIGTDYFADLEINTTRPAVNLGMRYKLDPRQAVKVDFTWGMIAGDDRLTAWQNRNNRLLQFRSHILEFGARYEFMAIKERVGHRYRLRGIKGQKHLELYPYGFIGIAGFYFNPQGLNQDGTWRSLRTLHTEGQTLISTRKEYSQFQFAIPMGVGFKYAIDKQWLVGVEYGMRKTFTDYIDDVSTTYFDNQTIKAVHGSTAAYLADPNFGANIDYAAGQQRGDPTDKDVYMFFLISINYKLKTGRNNLPKFN